MDRADLMQKRHEAIRSAQSLLDKAKEENRGLTEAEDKQYSERFNEAQKIADKIKVLDESRKLEKIQAGLEAKVETKLTEADGKEHYRSAFEKMVRFGNSAQYTSDEQRALQADLDVQGGFLVTPEVMLNQIIEGVDDLLFIRRYATTYRLPKGAEMSAAERDADPADADWTAEIATGGEDSTTAFGKRSLKPHPLAKLLKVSNTLMRISEFDVLNYISSRLSYKFAVTEEKSFLTGSGSNQPLGVFTTSADGINTDRQISTGNTTTEIRVDGLLSVKYELKPQYRRAARWLFHRDGVEQISKLKDGQGQYLWQPAKRADEPDTLLGFPVDESEFAPNTFTTGLLVGGLFDWKSCYWIVEQMDFRLQILRELYAATNQTGLIGRCEIDGQPVLSEACAIVTLA